MSKPGRKPRVSDDEILTVFRHSNDPVLKTREIVEQVSIGRRTLHDRLTRLEEENRLQSKKIGAKGKVWWLSTDDSLPPGGDFSAFIDAGLGMTIEDLRTMRKEAAEGDEKRWERLQATIEGDDREE